MDKLLIIQNYPFNCYRKNTLGQSEWPSQSEDQLKPLQKLPMSTEEKPSFAAKLTIPKQKMSSKLLNMQKEISSPNTNQERLLPLHKEG